MRPPARPPERAAVPKRLAALAVLAALGATLAGAPPAFPAEASVPARDGQDLAREAAAAWAEDARLVYVENDEALSGAGRAGRWGYLFYSPSLDATRAYSVRDGGIAIASDLALDFDAPPLPGEWIDSGDALAAADHEAGDFRRRNGVTVRAMFLVRGLLDPKSPDRPTWAVVYDAPQVSSLWVVVDASSGKVVKTWRG
jgi:hypothetical protein